MADAEVELGEQNGQFPRVLDAVDKNEGPRDVRFPDKVRQDLRLFQRILDIHETLFQLRGRRELLQYGRVFGLLLLGGPQDIFGFDDAGEEFRLEEVHPEELFGILTQRRAEEQFLRLPSVLLEIGYVQRSNLKSGDQI